MWVRLLCMYINKTKNDNTYQIIIVVFDKHLPDTYCYLKNTFLYNLLILTVEKCHYKRQNYA
jgi:hypothetical protein